MYCLNEITVRNTGGYLRSSAIISACGGYRYELRREWENRTVRRQAVFVMLNPSVADWRDDDPTIRRCVGFAKQWNCGSLMVVNLFAYRATQPKELRKAWHPIGERYANPHCGNFTPTYSEMNDNHIWRAAREADILVGAWGNDGAMMGRARQVMNDPLGEFRRVVQCFGITANGNPKHPLYMAKDASLVDYISQLNRKGRLKHDL